jgi:hypothetical protein
MKHLPASLILIALLIGTAGTASGTDGFADMQSARNYIHPSGSAHNTPAAALRNPEEAVPFHNGATLYCSSCHVMHASQQHPDGSSNGPDPFGPFPRSYTPSPKLLKAVDPVALCLACHNDVSGIPDVVDADANGLADRAAGHFAAPNVDNPRGHKLEYGLSSDPNDLCQRCHFGGTMATASVSCLDCHNVHGNGKYRNLQWASWPGYEPNFGVFTKPGVTGLARYEAANLGYYDPGTPDTREVTNMCTDCHHVYTGATYNDPDGTGFHVKHPSYDSERDDINNIAQGASRGTSDPAHWESGVGAGFEYTPRLRYVNHLATDFASSQAVDASVNGVFCLSCHKAHGGDRSFGLLWDPTLTTGGEGCDQCHNKTAQ